jgi:gluconolactonase
MEPSGMANGLHVDKNGDLLIAQGADTGGQITQIIADLFRPNGIEVSPDGRRLYVADNGDTGGLPINPNGPAKDRFGISGGGGVIAYDLDAKGNVSNGRVILRTEEVAADGMAMDTDGNLYVAMHNGNPEAPKADIVVLNPAGEIIKRLTPPAGSLSTNLGFGRGSDSGTLYMTSALPWRLYRIKTERHGHYFN